MVLHPDLPEAAPFPSRSFIVRALLRCRSAGFQRAEPFGRRAFLQLRAVRKKATYRLDPAENRQDIDIVGVRLASSLPERFYSIFTTLFISG